MKHFTIKLLTHAVILTGVLLVTTCNDEDPVISVRPDKLTVEANETDEKFVTIETNASSWEYREIATNWMEAYRRSDKDKLYIRAQEYSNTNDSRSSVIILSASIGKKNATAELLIEQLKKIINTLSTSPTSLSYQSNETGSKTVTITTDAPSWDATTSATWISIEKQGQTLIVTVSTTNTQTSDRTAEISITAGNAPPISLKVTQDRVNTLSVSPTSLSFDYNETSAKTVTVSTTASSWNATTSASWLSLSMNNNILTVTPTSQNTGSARTATIQVTAGNAPNVTVNVSQNAYPSGNQPISTDYNYSASGTPIYNSPFGYNNTTWTGIIYAFNDDTPPYIAIDGWANSNSHFYLDYVNGSYQLDRKTSLFKDTSGEYDGYMCMCTYNSSTQSVTIYPETDYKVNYNASTRVLDFTGTYNGLPTCIGIFGKSSFTGEWGVYFHNVYLNLKITLTSTASAPPLRIDSNAPDIKKFSKDPISIKVEGVKTDNKLKFIKAD